MAELIVPKFTLEQRLKIVTGERDAVVETCFKQDAALSAIRMENEGLRRSVRDQTRWLEELQDIIAGLEADLAAWEEVGKSLCLGRWPLNFPGKCQAEPCQETPRINPPPGNADFLTPAGNVDLQRVDSPSYPRVNGPVLDACNAAVVWPVKPPPEGDDSDYGYQTQPPPPPREIDPEVSPHWYDARPMSQADRDAIVDRIERRLDDENVRHAIRPRRPHPEVL